MISAISNYGISGVMLFWFMFRMEKVIKNNTQALENHKIIVEKCKRKEN